MIKLACILLISLAGITYFYRFGLDHSYAQGADVWGQFGDFMGGLLNPILSFISICLLIKSVNLQLDANKGLSKEIKRQEKIESYKKFEMRFFSLLEAQDSNFEKFRILLEEEQAADIDAEEKLAVNIEPLKSEFKAGSAVGYIDDSLSVLIKAGVDKERIIAWLEDLDVDDHYFSLIRRFYLIVKMIKEKFDECEQSEHIELLLQLTDEKLLTIIAILTEFYDWENIKYIKSCKILEDAGFGDYINNYKV